MTECFSFKVKPDRGKPFFFTVRVFHCKRAMMAHYNELPHLTTHPEKYKSVPSSFEAVTIPWVRYKNPRSKSIGPDLGEILFYRPQTGTGIVSHEITHAALHYARTMKYSLALDDEEAKNEEKLAHVIGHLSRQFFMRY